MATIIEPVKKLLKIAEGEIGYLEKASNKDLDSKTGNAGKNNYTKYARDIYPALQGQPWCDMYVDWCFVKAFGKVDAQRLLGGFSAYTPTSAQYYKDRGQWFDKPEIGDQIFFKNSMRICHTGLVCDKGTKEVITFEGNTNSSLGVVSNGGGVYKKVYSIDAKSISGYGRPDWSLVEEKKYRTGWNHDQYGWWYADSENTFFKSCWQVINGHKYYFNDHGYAATGWTKINGDWYFFENTPGHPLECAMYMTYDGGKQMVAMIL